MNLHFAQDLFLEIVLFKKCKKSIKSRNYTELCIESILYKVLYFVLDTIVVI